MQPPPACDASDAGDRRPRASAAIGVALDCDAIAAALQSGATVVTPNRRLARALKQSYDDAQIARGARAWPAADVLPWAAWLVRLHADLADDRPDLLSPLQETVLWERVIGASAAAGPLTGLRSLAAAASDAWRLLHAHASPDALARLPMSDDQAAYRDWAAAFARELRDRRALTPAELGTRLARDLATGLGRLPARLVQAGFEAPGAQHRRLVDALRARGVAVEEAAPAGAAAAVPVRVECADLRSQWRTVAAWARTRLGANPDARIGIVVPDLGAQRDALARALDEALCPARRVAPDSDALRPYNVSLGRPLSEAPLVASALSLFDLLHQPQPIAAVGSLLRSPFLGLEEPAQRAQLDAALRDDGAFELDLRALARHARRAAPPNAGGATPRLAAALAAVERQLQAAPRAWLPSRWAALLFDVLRAVGFPGGRPLGSAEYQTHQRWRETMMGVATLDALLGPVPLQTVVVRLRRLAAETVFQPESPLVPVQVLGVLESAHLAFDHLWVASLADDRWPPPANPNPLLPLSLQRAWGESAAAPEHALAAARRQQAGWSRAAAEVVFSHAALDGDAPCLPSPLTASLPARGVDQIGVAPRPPLASRLQRGIAGESLIDERGPPLAPGRAAGGTRIFTDQAACAFRAFAVHRLHAAPLAEPAPGFDPMTRGSLLHAALERFWQPLAGQQALLALDAGQVDAQVRAAADHALARLLARRPDALGPRLQALEAERLRRTLHAWLAIERARPPFEVVTVEAQRDAEVAGIELRVKPDRLDRVDGALLLIDYKTGEVSTADWQLPRPNEPQLPLYAVTAGERISALAFAQLRPGDMKLAALAERDGLLPQAEVVGAGPRRWDGLLGDWRQELERLARDFLAGAAAVDPKDPRRSCEHCPLPALCRIGERAAAFDEGGDA